MLKEILNPRVAFKEVDDTLPPSDKKSRDISIWIDDYDDIFSDFDPRPFSERNISDDFLNELKKVSRENNAAISKLQLLVPEKARREEDENAIAKSLHGFFRNNYHVLKKRVGNMKGRGVLFIIVSVLLLLWASYISSLKSESLLMHALLVLLEPAGWFCIWRGLESLIDSLKNDSPELNFYNKVAKSKIVFLNIPRNTSGEKHV